MFEPLLQLRWDLTKPLSKLYSKVLSLLMSLPKPIPTSPFFPLLNPFLADMPFGPGICLRLIRPTLLGGTAHFLQAGGAGTFAPLEQV